jgi:myo-inositol 2-dehydrogenase/D-chiro-inositol 1-dehydrogenase/scyllo-inositol 2-dehydrogenase (NAD+)
MLRFCVIGTGRAGLVHAANIDRRIKEAQLVALCDANPDTLAGVAAQYPTQGRYADYREALRDPQVDAVVVATPALLHCEIACEAAAQAKHIFLEKPMALSVDECERIIEAARRASVALQIGFMRRFDSAFVQAKEMLDSGNLGRVMIIRSTGRGPGLPPSWIYDVKNSNGMLAEVNSHDFDTVRWLVGSDIVRVYGEAVNLKCEEARESYPDFYDNAVVVLRFADETLGSIDGTCPAHYGYDARVEVLCEKGAIFVGSVRDRGVSWVTQEGSVMARTIDSWRSLFREAYIAEIEHFISCAEQGTMPRATGMDGLRAVEAVVAANASITSGQPVSLGKAR